MSQTTLFDALYRRRKNELMHVLVERLLPMYSDREIGLLRIDAIDPQILAQRSGRGFVNREPRSRPPANASADAISASSGRKEGPYSRALTGRPVITALRLA